MSEALKRDDARLRHRTTISIEGRFASRFGWQFQMAVPRE